MQVLKMQNKFVIKLSQNCATVQVRLKGVRLPLKMVSRQWLNFVYEKQQQWHREGSGREGRGRELVKKTRMNTAFQ